MKRAVRFGCLVLLCFGFPARADLQGDIEAILRDKFLAKATVGIEIVRLGHDETEARPAYEHDAHRLLTPASNLKLTTTSAALERFGPDFKFRTSLVLHEGDLVLIGDGDPSFGDAEYLRRVNWKPTTVFEKWAERLKQMNVSSVRNVIVDDGVFDQEFLHPHWPTNQIDHWYAAEVGGMNFDINCVTFVLQPTAPGTRATFDLWPPTHYVTVENSCVTGENDIQLGRKPGTNLVILKGQTPRSGSSTQQESIHDPPMYGATVLAETFESAGIKITGEVKRDRSMRQQRAKGRASAWQPVGIHETPIAVVLARANKDSINLYAEALCKRLGHDATQSPGSWENGTVAVGAFLKRAGVPESEFKLDDGSGLSRHNAISPSALVQVLKFDYFGKNHEAFLNSLSITGVDGTLEERFRGTDLRRRVIGKSGFVEGVSCLTGFLRAKDDQWYAFSILMNGLPYKSNSTAKALQERIVRALDAHTLPVSARRGEAGTIGS